MTQRKPRRVSWESWVDRQIREGRAQGAFDGLRGHGKPISDIDTPHDDLWWVKRKLEREEVALTPLSIQLRLEVDATLEGLGRFADETRLRAHLADLNDRIRRSNRVAHSGPPTTLMPLDVDRVVARWHEAPQ